MGRWKGGDEVYQPIWDEDGDPDQDPADWVEEPRSGVRLVATGAAAAILLCLGFFLLVALCYPVVESVFQFLGDRMDGWANGGH